MTRHDLAFHWTKLPEGNAYQGLQSTHHLPSFAPWRGTIPASTWKKGHLSLTHTVVPPNTQLFFFSLFLVSHLSTHCGTYESKTDLAPKVFARPFHILYGINGSNPFKTPDSNLSEYFHDISDLITSKHSTTICQKTSYRSIDTLSIVK